jgi:hypothetical protein
LGRKLGDSGVEPAGGHLEALEVGLGVAITELLISDHPKPFAQGIAQI